MSILINNNRIINVSAGVNFRDIGGYRTADGNSVKWHKLVRGGYLSDLTDSDQKLLINHGITTIMDFRSTAEVTQFPDKIPSEMKYVHLPVFDNDETESTETTRQLHNNYSDCEKGGYLRMLYVYRRLVINKQPQSAYKKFFEYLIAHGRDESILFHCSAGKDRTGMGAILLLSALGVDSQTILDDYMLTNQTSIPRIEWRVNEAKKSFKNKNFIQSIIDLSSVSKDYYNQSMAIINYEYGGMQAYLKDVIGLTAEMITELKAIYLE